MADENFPMENLKGLPMSDLIGNPLQSAVAAQTALATAMSKYIRDIGFTVENPGTNEKWTAHTFDFAVKQTSTGATGTQDRETNVSVPALTTMPMPALLIDLVEIDFQMEVTQALASTVTTSGSASLDAKVGWGFISATVQGKISSSKENTRKTDTSAKYQVKVKATQQPVPEGLSRLMERLNDLITPLPVEGAHP